MKKVNLEALKPWITQRIITLLDGLEDDILIQMVFNLLAGNFQLMNSLCLFTYF